MSTVAEGCAANFKPVHVCIKAAVACSESEYSCLKVSRKVVYVVFEILNVHSVFHALLVLFFRSVFVS